MEPTAVPEIDPVEAARLLDGIAVLLDVREEEEWSAGRAPAARHVPLGMLGARLGELPANETIVVVCRSGHRSALAAEALRSAGYDARNLSGGMTAWLASGLPVVDDAGQPGAVI